jgi:hypothetical protein
MEDRSMYESGDQRNVPVSELKERARYAEGMPTSHKNLPCRVDLRLIRTFCVDVE